MRKPYIDAGRLVTAASMLVVNIKEPESYRETRLFLEKEKRTFPKLTELARKGRIKRHKPK